MQGFVAKAPIYLALNRVAQQLLSPEVLFIFSVEDNVYALPGGISNIENGLGYIVGINSNWIPFKKCKNSDTGITVACEEEDPLVNILLVGSRCSPKSGLNQTCSWRERPLALVRLA